MNYYIGTALVKAQPMTRGEYNKFRGWEAPKGEDQTIDGYLVEDETRYIFWRPGCQFDKCYLKVDDNPNLPSGVSVGAKMVDDFIVDYEVFTKKDKITIVIATLVNGFTIVESSACVDPQNYNEEIGAEICKERIKNQVWNHLGFLLQTAYKGIK
ncbi:Gp49 family protein [Clostridium beijerinckii]|uniref:Gp49 family protein n=1 Tax=Clostridium beijerinckii TaxID=1520 RepID=UPI000479082C|nr:Gp49 family protein [Clostridium beijerinckii]